MALTASQKTALAAGLRAETDATVVAALAKGDHVYLETWCNGNSTTDVWNVLRGADLFELTDIPKFIGLVAANRDAWRLMLDFAPIDFTRGPTRKSVVDVWGATDGPTVLQGGKRKGTKGEIYIGGSTATTGAVSALKLDYSGPLTYTDIGQALLANP
jgi:hypothetical protein